MKQIDDYDLFDQDFDRFVQLGLEAFASEVKEIERGGENRCGREQTLERTD